MDNLEEVLGDLNAMVDDLQFDRPGREETIGKGALVLLSERIQERCRAEQDPSGSAWPENKEWAKTNKLKQGKPVGVLGDVSDESMLAEVNIDGFREITADQASMTYGGNAKAERKAEWFSNGSTVQAEGTERSGAKNQEPRPFYELGEGDEEALDDYFKAEFDSVVGRHGGAP